MQRISILATILLFTACGVEMSPGNKSHARRDIPPGPGLLTGDQGEFVIYRRQSEATETGE